jgi:hypothetical protein
MNCNAVNISIINEPNNLIGEQLSVILGVQVGLSWLRTIQLKALPNPLPQNVQCRVRLHYFIHRLKDEVLHVREPIAECRMQIIRKINCNQVASRTRVDTNIISSIVKELRPSVPLDIM